MLAGCVRGAVMASGGGKSRNLPSASYLITNESMYLRVITLRLVWLPATTPLPHRRLEQRDHRATGRAPPTTAGSTWGSATPRLVDPNDTAIQCARESQASVPGNP